MNWHVWGENFLKPSRHVLIEFVPFTFTLYGQPISVENVLCAVVFLLLILFPIVQSTFLPLVGVFFSMMAQEREKGARSMLSWVKDISGRTECFVPFGLSSRLRVYLLPFTKINVRE